MSFIKGITFQGTRLILMAACTAIIIWNQSLASKPVPVCQYAPHRKGLQEEIQTDLEYRLIAGHCKCLACISSPQGATCRSKRA